MAQFQAGPLTLAIPMALYAKNRSRLVAELKTLGTEGAKAEYAGLGKIPENAVVVLQGGKQECRHDTDHEELFRQESFFHWAFGVSEADCYGAVHVATGKSLLFIPRLGPEYAVWMGRIAPPEEFKARYEVDSVHFVDELASVLKSLDVGGNLVLLALHGLNSDSGSHSLPLSFPGLETFAVDKALLYPAIASLRVYKTEEELKVLRYVAEVSSRAHVQVMRSVKPGMSEFQLESLFLHECYFHGGCRHASYTCICATGTNSAVLHYGHAGAPNSRIVRDGDLCLFDMGGEYACYGADITCTFPANGTFTAPQKIVYNAVLDATRAVIAAIRPGVVWVDMHLLAERVILTALKAAGLIQGDIEAAAKARVGAVFMPHGLGHFLGIDTHDVGGYPSGVERPSGAGLRKLRTARTLQAGMYLTVEPGCYFMEATLEPAYANGEVAPFLVKERIAEFLPIGGVRIEEDVLVTETGAEVFSKVPRTVEEIEHLMGARWLSS